MFLCMEAKTQPMSVRLPLDLFDRFMAIKTKQAHKRVPNSEFLLEAVRLYVVLGEHFGIDENLMVSQPIGPYKPAAKKASDRKVVNASKEGEE